MRSLASAESESVGGGGLWDVITSWWNWQTGALVQPKIYGVPPPPEPPAPSSPGLPPGEFWPYT
jgi:hypothetical protein